MNRTKIKEIFEKNIVGDDFTIKGWVRSVRKGKSFSFIVVNDGTCQNSIQIVADQVLPNYETVSAMLTGYCISVTGKLVQSQGKGQAIEMQASSVEVLGVANTEFPLQKKATSLEFLREVAHLRPRTNTFGAVFRIRHLLAQATHQFFDKEGLFYLNTPIITGSDCEGAGEMFQVTTLKLDNCPKNTKGEVDFEQDYFGKSTNLTVSGQLEAECFAMGMGGVYTFGPTFRSENSNTSRHLSEFWMVEPEVAFADLEEVADLASRYIKALITAALDKGRDELTFLQQNYDANLITTLEHVKNSEFKKITYTEAVDILIEAAKTEKFEYKVAWGSDLQSEHERYLCEKHFKVPTIVTDYPKEIKSFYMKQNADGKTVRAMDVLVPGVGELIGGSQREERLEFLQKRMEELKLPMEEYWWYLDLRRFGTAPHAGFGLGFERAVMYITGMSNIRDVIPFPRTPKSAEF
ncbi:MAG: asparagine--tRNA ligase [Bacteriovoracaceae bacterium]